MSAPTEASIDFVSLSNNEAPYRAASAVPRNRLPIEQIASSKDPFSALSRNVGS